MADMKPQVYKDPRPAEYFAQFHEAARKGVGWTYTLGRIVLTLPTLLIYRVRKIGLENVPREGALILAPNHFSQMDHFFVGVYLRRKIRFMAKSQMFGPPVLTYIYKHGGVFPVRRGHHDEEAIETAREILRQEEMLLVYAEGGRSRSQALRTPKPGIGRIALETGAPGRPRRDLRLGQGARLEAAALPQGHHPVRRADLLSDRAGAEPRAAARGRDRDFRAGAGDVRGARYSQRASIRE